MRRAGRAIVAGILLTSAGLALAQSAPDQAERLRASVVARGKALERPGSWTPAPGSPLSNYTAGYAHLLCQQVFVSGMDADFARMTLGDNNALSPVGLRAQTRAPVIDRVRKEVRVTTIGGETRTARYIGDLGCVTLPVDGVLHFTPKPIPRAAAKPGLWPTGEQVDPRPPAEIDAAKLAQAVDAAFAPESALTQAVVIAWRGRIVAERYGPEANAATPLEGWSMGKSVVATLMGVLIQRGAYTLDQPAPIPEWQKPGDGRQAIRIRDLLNMSSGLRSRAVQDPDYVYDGSFPDHWYYYTGPNAFAYAATRPQQWAPATVGRYRNTDVALTGYLIRQAVEGGGEEYHSFPQRALFDPLGIRSAVLEVDAHGNFLTQGYELMSARDWARLGQLYLNDGVWDGRRLLPEGFTKFVSTLAPAWVADGRPVYGGFFWINGTRDWPVPETSYFMAGVGGQYVFVIPTHDLVVVRIGRSAGQRSGEAGLRTTLKLLMEAVPKRP